VKAFFDIGGAGHSSDAMAIWIAQFVGREIRLLDYVEGVGQPLAYYAHELRRRGWKDVIVYLPHDGVATNNITGKRYIDHWTEAGFECGIPIKNTGAGAAMMRIEAARRVFPRCWFNDSTTEAGRDALGYYHERQDEKRSIGLGPEHDWSSHAQPKRSKRPFKTRWISGIGSRRNGKTVTCSRAPHRAVGSGLL
jgi:phage terminase large subunit